MTAIRHDPVEASLQHDREQLVARGVLAPDDAAPFESIDAAVSVLNRVLPGWWHTAGLCSLTGHASIGPDYNGPDGERLRREFPPERFDAGFDADLAPGDGTARLCQALMNCLVQALKAAASPAI
jgi:hypothetical protein